MLEDMMNPVSFDIKFRALIAVNLKALREKNGMTQEKLANNTGISRLSIERYETCHQSISIYNILKIAKAMGETPNSLLKGWEDIT